MNGVLHDVFREAERLVLARMADVTLADLRRGFAGQTLSGVAHPGDS